MQHAALIDRWAAGRGLPVGRMATHGRLTFTVDGRYRVHLGEGRANGFTVESRIRDLPHDEGERDRLVEWVLRVSVARMRVDDAILVVDRHGGALVLQSNIPGPVDERGLSEGIARFINSMAFWRGIAR